MPYNLDYYVPLPPRRPEFYDQNALAQMLDPPQIMLERFRQTMQFQQPGSMLGIRERQRIADQPIPMSSSLGGRDPTGMQGPEYDPGVLNYLRAMLGY